MPADASIVGKRIVERSNARAILARLWAWTVVFRPLVRSVIQLAATPARRDASAWLIPSAPNNPSRPTPSRVPAIPARPLHVETGKGSRWGLFAYCRQSLERRSRRRPSSRWRSARNES